MYEDLDALGRNRTGNLVMAFLVLVTRSTIELRGLLLLEAIPLFKYIYQPKQVRVQTAMCGLLQPHIAFSEHFNYRIMLSSNEPRFFLQRGSP